jgi:hypothetical protein
MSKLLFEMDYNIQQYEKMINEVHFGTEDENNRSGVKAGAIGAITAGVLGAAAATSGAIIGAAAAASGAFAAGGAVIDGITTAAIVLLGPGLVSILAIGVGWGLIRYYTGLKRSYDKTKALIQEVKENPGLASILEKRLVAHRSKYKHLESKVNEMVIKLQERVKSNSSNSKLQDKLQKAIKSKSILESFKL